MTPPTYPCVMCLMTPDSMAMLSDGRCCSGCREGCMCASPPGAYKAARWRHQHPDQLLPDLP